MCKEAEKCWLSAVSGICIIAAQNILDDETVKQTAVFVELIDNQQRF